MTILRSLLFLAFVIVFCRPVTAHAQTDDAQQQPPPETRQEMLLRQREAKQDELEPYVVSRAEERVRFFESWRLPRRLFAKGFAGFRPVIGGMPSGSGFVGGGGYIAGYNSSLLQFSTNARFSTRGYQAYDAELLISPRSNSVLPVEGYLRAVSRDFSSLRFFGLGPATSRGNRSTYRLEDQSFETGLTAWAGRYAEAGANVQWLTAESSSGVSGASLEDRFDGFATPGFGVESDFFVYGAHATVHLRDSDILPSVGVSLRVDAHRFDDQDSDAFDFTRVVGDVQAHIPIGYRNRMLALRVRASNSVADSGAQVPFYLMETLGGANTIRGFKEYRFRDLRNLLINAEYRWEVWTYLDFAFFYDAGKVFSSSREFSLDGLKSGYGFGLRGHGPTGVVMRFDFARSNEGFILHVGSGPSF